MKDMETSNTWQYIRVARSLYIKLFPSTSNKYCTVHSYVLLLSYIAAILADIYILYCTVTSWSHTVHTTQYTVRDF